ncbi:MAG: hypothetical protein ABSF71_28610 [Terriglobia bacterium]|jgi:hypothetical protein
MMDDTTFLVWIDRGKNIAAFLVALGVAGEFLGDFISGPARKRQGEAQRTQIAILNQQTLELENSNKQLAIGLAAAKDNLSLKQSELAQEQRKTAEAQTKAAEAQRELSQSFGLYVRRSGNRVLNVNELTDSLAGRAKKAVEIWYKPDDSEVRRFADDIFLAFQNAKWLVSMRPYKDDETLDGIPLGRVKGIMLASKDKADVTGLDSLLMTLLKAQLLGGGGAATGSRELPDNTVVIIVGAEIGL